MAKWFVFVFGLLGLCWQVGGRGNKYDNYTLMRITPHRQEHLEALARLPEDPDGEMGFLKRSYGVNDTADVLVSPNKVKELEEFVDDHDMPVEYKHHYGRSFEPVERLPRRRMMNTFNFYTFNPYDAMRNYIDALPSRVPGLVTVQNVGVSYEHRKMQLVKISTDPNAGNPVIFIDAGIHAREWVAPAMAMYLIHRLTSDPAARARELDGVDWYILPVVNPDGYEYSRGSRSNRLWRKTRSQHSQRLTCVGVDGNRNYGFKWGVSGVSNDPCNMETYAGPKPFSEVETKIVSKIMMDYKDRIKLYVSLHSYGQYLVYPWGYTGDILPREWKKLDALARMVSNTVQRSGGRPFTVMSAGKWYAAAGGSDDFAFSVGIPYSYTMELTDGYEFTFPKERLATVLPQFYEGFKTFGIQIKKEFGSACCRI